MYITKKWLKQYLCGELQTDVLVDTLNRIGLEVDNITDYSDIYRGIKIGRILQIDKHPNADKLSICLVDIGNETLTIVCGAPNVRNNAFVVVATIGSILPSGMAIKKSKIRSITSHGMLCSGSELAIRPSVIPPHLYNNTFADDSGIIVLSDSTSNNVGQDLAEYLQLDDVVLDIFITPNRRIDCGGVRGIARDLYATGLGDTANAEITINPLNKVNKKNTYKAGNDASSSQNAICVIEDNSLINQLQLVKISNVNLQHHIHSSALTNQYHEIESRLRMINIYHDNVLVNISNYVMFDTARPNHIYDADKINGVIKVRRSIANENFTPLNMDKIALPPGILVIADDEKILSIAGVIGGELSKVDSSTKNIVIELANFDRKSIIKARSLDIRTEAYWHFESGVDSGNGTVVMTMLTKMVLNYCGGNIEDSFTFDNKSTEKDSALSLSFDMNLFRTFAEYHVTQEEVITILEKLGFKINSISGSTLDIAIPSWRTGFVSNSSDIIEEVLRIKGFEALHDVSVDVPMNIEQYRSVLYMDREKKIVDTLLHRGLTQMISWSFISNKVSQIFGDSDTVKIQNPINEEMSIMRSTIVPNLLLTLKNSLLRDIEDVAIFEYGNVYQRNGNDITNIVQYRSVAGLRYGMVSSHNIHKSNRSWDFYDVKADVLSILQKEGIEQDSIIVTRDTPSYYHPERSAAFLRNNKVIGYCGELHPSVCSKMEIKNKATATVQIFELMCDHIMLPSSTSSNNVEPAPLLLSQYQSVTRDLTFVIDKTMNAGDILIATKKIRNNDVLSIKLIDAFPHEGQNDNNKQSVSIRIVMQSAKETLEKNTVDSFINDIITVISKDCNAILKIDYAKS